MSRCRETGHKAGMHRDGISFDYIQGRTRRRTDYTTPCAAPLTLADYKLNARPRGTLPAHYTQANSRGVIGRPEPLPAVAAVGMDAGPGGAAATAGVPVVAQLGDNGADTTAGGAERGRFACCAAGAVPAQLLHAIHHERWRG